MNQYEYASSHDAIVTPDELRQDRNADNAEGHADAHQYDPECSCDACEQAYADAQGNDDFTTNPVTADDIRPLSEPADRNADNAEGHAEAHEEEHNAMDLSGVYHEQPETGLFTIVLERCPNDDFAWYCTRADGSQFTLTSAQIAEHLNYGRWTRHYSTASILITAPHPFLDVDIAPAHCARCGSPNGRCHCEICPKCGNLGHLGYFDTPEHELMCPACAADAR